MLQEQRRQNETQRNTSSNNNPSSPAVADPLLEAQDSMGNAATIELIDAEQKVEGPMGRVFNRILGESENRTDTTLASFGLQQLEAYLKHTLAFARDEWFRGKKISGAASSLMDQLDSNGDGRVDWNEFQAFRAQTLSSIAPGAKIGDDSGQVGDSAQQSFSELDGSGGSGELSFAEIQAGARNSLPPETEHLDLISQLAARIALDAVDTDQRDVEIEDRTLSQEEWVEAAKAMASETSA